MRRREHTGNHAWKSDRHVPFGLTLMLLVGMLFVLGACYNDRPRAHRPSIALTSSLANDTLEQANPVDSAALRRRQDSLRFLREHHYSENFNFVVRADSLPLVRQQPEEVLSQMPADTFCVHRHERLVVADIRIMPADGQDTVWVQVARDQFTFGWTHEGELLRAVDPDDPISQFITTFSDTHLLLFLIVVSLIAGAYIAYLARCHRAPIVHLRDIPSVYPTLLTLIVAASATLYASIQMFAPELWRDFYFNPTLNPFSVPSVMMVFLVLVWSMLIVGLACIDVVRQHLSASDGVVYLCGLVGVCAVDYIVFSLTTLYYVGYFLLLAYAIFAVSRYRRHSHCRYECGHCGMPMHRKGRCPRCGAVNE